MRLYMLNMALQADGGGGGFAFAGFLPLVFILGIFYFLLIRPQQTRQKRWQQMLETLKAGDRVVTGGGIRGTILSVKEDVVTLRVPPDNLRVEVMRRSVMEVQAEDSKA
jgi:preprotein translocase subunit YajC